MTVSYAPAHASFVIDSFNDTMPQTVIDSLSFPGFDTSTSSTSSALGGFRTISIDDGGNASTAVVESGTFSHNGASNSATSIITCVMV